MKENDWLKKIISETIEQMLDEQDYGSESDTMGGIYNDYSSSPDMGAGTSAPAGSILGVLPIGIAPRVAKTLAWGVENMSQRVGSLLRTLFAYVTKAFIPGLSAANDYKQIRNDEIAGLERIDKKYAETLSANLAVLKDLDAWGIVFLLDPSLGLGWRLAEKSPQLAMTILDSLTAGNASRLLKSFMATHKIKSQNKKDNINRFFAQIGFTDFGLSEQAGNDSGSMDGVQEFLKQFLNSKEVTQAINSSGVAPKIKTYASRAILARATKAEKAKSIEELVKLMPEIAAPAQQALNSLLGQAQKNKLNPQEIEQAKLGLLNQIKGEAKKVAIKNLSNAAENNKNISNAVSGLIKQIQTIK